MLLLVAWIAGAAAAQEDGGTGQLIAQGRVVYDASCAGCHGADGSGVSGNPPLVASERIADDGYLTDVIRRGLEGELVVEGVTYNGVMPGFASLDDTQMEALIAFVQDGLVAAPPPPPVSGGGGEGTAGTELPFGVVFTYGLGLLIFVAAAVFVLGPFVVGRRDEKDGEFTTAQVWLKSAVIVLYFVVATVILPSAIIESRILAEPPSAYRDLFSSSAWRTIRDLIGAGAWVGALGIGIWGLRRAQRKRII